MEISAMRLFATTNVTIDAADSLNAIVARYPQALPVLKRFGLDTCCGGALPLRTVVQHHDLDLDELIAALHTALEEDQRCSAAPAHI
jgi:regulator of cell morphogenesis and NO signaling